MEWIEVFVATSETGIDPVCGFLYECGLTGLMIEDGKDFQEFLENPNRTWDYIADELVQEKTSHETGITFFVRDNLIGKEQLAGIQSGLIGIKQREKELDLGALTLHMKNIREEDWANNWKQYFKPFPVGKRLMIKPSWEELTEPTEKVVLKIDPGHIFGTGTHETTQLCMEHIENYVNGGERVLDIGCGSGILSVASLLLGAETAYAVDIDPNAVEVAYENADRNEIQRERYHVCSGNLFEDETLDNSYQGNTFDVVEANIVADIIIALCDKVPNYIKPQGIFITSGIIEERLEDVYLALTGHGFKILDTKMKNGWCAIASRYIGKK